MNEWMNEKYKPKKKLLLFPQKIIRNFKKNWNNSEIILSKDTHK